MHRPATVRVGRRQRHHQGSRGIAAKKTIPFSQHHLSANTCGAEAAPSPAGHSQLTRISGSAMISAVRSGSVSAWRWCGRANGGIILSLLYTDCGAHHLNSGSI